MKGNNIDRIIKENIQKYINNVLKEDIEEKQNIQLISYLKPIFWQAIKDNQKYLSVYFDGDHKDNIEVEVGYSDSNDEWGFSMKVDIEYRYVKDPDSFDESDMWYFSCTVDALNEYTDQNIVWDLEENELKMLQKYCPITFDEDTLYHIYDPYWNWTEDD